MKTMINMLPSVALAIAIGLVGTAVLLHWAGWLLPWAS